MLGIDPINWLLAELGSRLGPVLGVLLILGLIFWGGWLGFARRFFKNAAAASRRSARKPGEALCADCAAVLVGGRCPECRGHWLKEDALAGLLSRKGRPERPWFADEGAPAGPPCPECGGGMAAGRLKGEDFPAQRCGACRGLWFGRVEAVSLELRVLG